jgi:L-ascorbate metabolism protein UlaG (beta-lactamase superfamily)
MASLGGMLRRVSAPGIAIDRLPKLDMILLTHAHADHLSFRSLAQLGAVPLYAPPATARWVRRHGFVNAIELSPGESLTTGNLSVFPETAAHSGNRYVVDRWRKAANMYLLATKYESLFFAGDTGLTAHTATVVNRELGARRLDVALLPIGIAPNWKVTFREGHLTSRDALTLFERLDARYLIPYHWGTFNHVTASAHDAITELRTDVTTHARGSDVRILDPGECFQVKPQDS